MGSALALATGIAASRFSPAAGPALPGALAAASLGAWALARRLRPASALPAAAALVLFWANGGAWLEAERHEIFLSSPLLSAPSLLARAESHAPTRLRGWVGGEPVRRERRLIFLLRVEEAFWKGSWRRSPGLVRISLRDEDESCSLRYGDRIEASARLRRPRSFRNPGAFDYGRYLEGEGVHLAGTVKTPLLVRRLPGRRGGAARLPHALRRRLLRRLEQAFPRREGAPARRFLEAVLLGERRGGEGDLEKLLRKTGVYHILSVSGLHFALLLSGLGSAVRRLPGGRRLAPPLLGAAALLYVSLSGGRDPILRCAISALLVAAGRWSGRRVTAWNAQAQAGIVLLLLHPLHLFDAGFQLSFAATLGILSWGRREPTPDSEGPPPREGPFSLSLGAWTASLPLLATDFCQVSPVALALNLAAAPFLSGSLLLGACLLVLPSPALGALMQGALLLFTALCRLSLRIPGAYLRVPAPPPLVQLAFLTFLLMHRLTARHPASRRERWKRRLFLLALAAWIAAPPAPLRAATTLELVALDVGQGDAILLRLPGGKNVLVDAGGFKGTDFDVGEKVVVPALFALGVRRLDLVVLTHAHQDHGGGMPAVLETFAPRQVWVGRSPPVSALLARVTRAAGRRDIPVLHPTRDSLACLGESCLQVLHPPSRYREGAEVSNDDSLVLRLSFRGASVLLAGDIEREGEFLLLSSGLPLASDILKVPHHGSASSTSDSLLDAVRPAAAVLSVGEGNPWRHPSARVLKRLKERGVVLFRTDRQGAVRLAWTGRGWRRSELPE